MSANPNWDRWLFASFSEHFSSGLKDDATVFIEGQLRRTDTSSSFYEIRVDGPYITCVGPSRYRLWSEVNILCSANLVENNNYHRIRSMAGLVASLFRNVKIYNFDGPEPIFIGCAVLVQNLRKHERVQISHFGQIEPDVPLLQATVEGHFEITLTN